MTRIISISLPSHKRRAASATRITKLVKLIVSFEIGFRFTNECWKFLMLFEDLTSHWGLE